MADTRRACRRAGCSLSDNRRRRSVNTSADSDSASASASVASAACAACAATATAASSSMSSRLVSSPSSQAFGRAGSRAWRHGGGGAASASRCLLASRASFLAPMAETVSAASDASWAAADAADAWTQCSFKFTAHCSSVACTACTASKLKEPLVLTLLSSSLSSSRSLGSPPQQCVADRLRGVGMGGTGPAAGAPSSPPLSFMPPMSPPIPPQICQVDLPLPAAS